VEQSSSPTPASHDIGLTLTEALAKYGDAWACGAGPRPPGAEIREHAQVEHPEVAWDAQATTFVTARFAEGRAR
jgi:hypothetical protein